MSKIVTFLLLFTYSIVQPNSVVAPVGQVKRFDLAVLSFKPHHFKPLIMQEIWKDIKGYEGLYQVSNLGNVKSFKQIPKGKILTKRLNMSGYYWVALYKNCYRIDIKIHQLVWNAFGNKSKDNANLIIDHIDENKQNNMINNLQLLTIRDNVIKSKNKTKTSSKYTGVTFNKNANKWKAYTTFNNNQIHIGYYSSEIKAFEAYKQYIKSILT